MVLLFPRHVTLVWHVFCLVVLAVGGCSGPGPRLFPVTPISHDHTQRRYDINSDGNADYIEQLSSGGHVELLRFDLDHDGEYELEVDRTDLSGQPDVRHLVVILDSIPFAMVEELYRHGRFRLFQPPSRVISPFPVMTDLALGEFFGTSPTPAVESQFYDGKRLNNGYGTYSRQENMPWLSRVDYALRSSAHGLAYLEHYNWYGHELRQIEETYDASNAELTVAYVVGTSAAGAQDGRNGHQVSLVKLDRFCQSLMYQSKGRIQITLMSDHGHNFVRSRLLPLAQILERLGYRNAKKLREPQDIIVPEFGIVTMAAIHTLQPQAVARDVVGIEGIDMAGYRADGEIVVLSRMGEARISRSADSYCYEPRYGDPLRLLPIWQDLRQKGKVNSLGFVDDAHLHEATLDHTYPDVVHRFWRAFHGLVKHTPDVLVSVEDGFHCGSYFMDKMLHLSGVHGNLNQPSSYGFVMSTVGRVPPIVRMEDLRELLVERGVPMKERGSTNE